ncbi:NAD-dependent epimerase/dehydratase [Streptomyces sp. 4F]|nr:NAD-dependent epimerase/dehydratase [Streptomyces sp. 4F]
MVSRPLITVLGASGFIGSHVVAELAVRPVRLRAVARRPTVPAGLGRSVADVETCAVDLSRPGALAEAVAGSDAVVHLVAHLDGAGAWRAADGDSAAERLNTGLVQELADALRPTPAAGRPPAVVLFASTATTAPDPASTAPATPYERQKAAAERILADATAAGELCGVSLRLPTVFGPATAPAVDRGVVSAMARRALDGEPITMWHDGTVRRDLLYVRDAATAFTAALDHARTLAGRHWSVGSGHATPLGDVFRALAATVASRTGGPPVPVRRVEPPAFASAADFRDVRTDPAPFGSATGWAPRVPLREALDRTVAALAGPHGKDLL